MFGPVLGALLLIAMHAAGAAAQPYRVVPLDTSSCATPISVTAINENLQVAGRCRGITVWNGSGQIELTVPVPVPQTFLGVADITNDGTIAGTFITYPGGVETFTAFLYRHGTFTYPFAHRTSAAARRLTNSGILLGVPNNEAWYAGRIYPLGDGRVADIAETGLMIGYYSDGSLTSLDPFLRSPDGAQRRPWPEPLAVQQLGPAGHFVRLEGNQLWYGSPDFTVQRIVLPFNCRPSPPSPCNDVRDVNASGDVLGMYYHGVGPSVPFVWQRGRVVDVNALLMEPTRRVEFVHKLTDTGVILAQLERSGQLSPVYALLVPTPPPVPSGLAVAVVGRVVTLGWQASLGATDYVVEAGNSPGSANVLVAPVGAVTTVSAAVAPGRYYARVRARGAAGLSGPSPDVVIDVP
jgi:hypothetical protein